MPPQSAHSALHGLRPAVLGLAQKCQFQRENKNNHKNENDFEGNKLVSY